jgi:o-succinylbenzoate synthase
VIDPGGASISIDRIDLHEVAMPLVRPFRTSFGEQLERRALLLHVISGDAEGWGECVAGEEPRYSEEWVRGAWLVLEEILCPALLSGEPLTDPGQVPERLAWIRGNRMAKAGLEAAALDAWLRAAGRSLADYLGGVRDRVPCGVSVGIARSAEAMLEEIRGYLEQGYRRIKLKIEPGRDAEVVRTIRRALPETPLSVDANSAYTLADAPVFEALDELDLVMIEQPLSNEDLLDHAKLQRRLRTALCLDESIRSARDAAAAIELGSCRIINIKPGRVGGLLEAKRVHDVASERGAPVWIGGMLETGIGRAANLALAALPGVTLPGDTSASDRYWAEDITRPFVLDPDGTMAVPTGPGIGTRPVEDRLKACTVRFATVSRP